MLCPVEALFPKSAPIRRFGKVSKSHFCGMRKSSIMTVWKTQHISWAMNAASSPAFLWPLLIYSLKKVLATSMSNCCAFNICHSIVPEMKIPFLLSHRIGNLLVSSWEFSSVASVTAPRDGGCHALLYVKDREVDALFMPEPTCVTNGHLQINLFSVQMSICHSPLIWCRTSTVRVWIYVYDLRGGTGICYLLFLIGFFPGGTIDILSFTQPL